ncbi:MAG TPA: hypothetical protein VMT10_04315 [Solirubrobacteraceae bacterium]|nr:hypothetical protein [Solirubrobacteraceae bacterium]
MPLPAVLALLALMALALACGFLGPAARRVRPLPTIALLAIGVASLPGGWAATHAHHRAVGMLVITAGVCALALAARLLRAAAGPGRGGGEPPPDVPPPGPAPGPVVDWDAFDRKRERWGRRPTGVV